MRYLLDNLAKPLEYYFISFIMNLQVIDSFALAVFIALYLLNVEQSHYLLLRLILGCFVGLTLVFRF